MIAIRICLLASALGLAAPASAGWWSASNAVQPGGNDTVAAAPAHVAHSKKPVSSTAVPEPADFALFAAGVVGLLLGRRGSRSRRD